MQLFIPISCLKLSPIIFYGKRNLHYLTISCSQLKSDLIIFYCIIPMSYPLPFIIKEISLQVGCLSFNLIHLNPISTKNLSFGRIPNNIFQTNGQLISLNSACSIHLYPKSIISVFPSWHFHVRSFYPR